MTALWQDRQIAQQAAEKLKVFAQPQRLMILSALLAHRELSVSAIDEATGIGQPALSQQLAELRKASLVETRREAKQIHYRLADDLTTLCAHSIETVFGQPPSAQISDAQSSDTQSSDTPPSTVQPDGAAKANTATPPAQAFSAAALGSAAAFALILG